jgi:very-short-patch-repair endonuclease
MAAAYERAFAASRSSVGGRAAAAVRTRVAALESSGASGVRDQLARLAELRALQRPRRSIRTLIRQTSTPLAALKPVVLASPLSAAMHLDPDLPPFDLVVFDEASQVPLADAIGALSRAGSAIVVGDSKQLPPTTFFDAAGGGDDPGAGTAAGTEAEEEPGFEELESVLDEFVASRFPELMLRWHYRSRDERLIAFSNAAIYGGKLQTFPCAFRTHPNLGVGMRAVAGAYDRARTRTNPAEARAVVDELAARLCSADATPTNRSLGVVAFSLAQQSAIQDLFDELVDGDDAVRATVAGLEEPVLIKNLESIQGDERATMLFSVGYGRDESGRMAMNFGPMNRAGGERRLNVAITRAREQMLVFSTIRANDIDLARSGASGVRLLRDFLEFAERGTLMPAASVAGGGQGVAAHAGRPDALEESIARALESRGWTVDRHVGTSGYRVSLALRDRTHPERWCLGIELDGPFWQSGETVADRELLRRDVLRRLGWQTIRVWSAEWLGDPAKAIERIEAAAACRRT